MVFPLASLLATVLVFLATTGAAQAKSCRSESLKGTSYIVCSFDPTKDGLRLFWRGDDGEPYRTFTALAEDLKGKGKWLRFAMNGGMYRSDLRPVGLYIENGRELNPANTVTLSGTSSQIPNFYKKPNGVFFIGNGGAGVLETNRPQAVGNLHGACASLPEEIKRDRRGVVTPRRALWRQVRENDRQLVAHFRASSGMSGEGRERAEKPATRWLSGPDSNFAHRGDRPESRGFRLDFSCKESVGGGDGQTE
jgi:hypothetical protein